MPTNLAPDVEAAVIAIRKKVQESCDLGVSAANKYVALALTDPFIVQVVFDQAVKEVAGDTKGAQSRKYKRSGGQHA